MLETDEHMNDMVPEAAEARLWASYRLTNDPAVREQLIRLYLPYARIIAAKLYAGRHHDQFEFDEYLQFATVGLMESIERFDPSRGAQFKTFASRRMMGAILNGLECLSEKQQQIALRQRLAAERVESLKGEQALSKRTADDLFRYLADVGIGIALGFLLEGTGLVDTGEQSGLSHYDSLELKQLERQVRELVNLLPEKEQQVIRYHYLQDIPFQEIADMLDLTKGRISQLHKRALELLRTRMQTHATCDVAW